MTAALSSALPVLLVTGAGRVFALPLAHLRETMRPLPVDPVAGAPNFVLGLSRIRGAVLPVVTLAGLMGASDAGAPCKRFVTLELEERAVALAVDDVLGVKDLDPALLEDLPPLVRGMSSGHVTALGSHDARLLLLLDTARLIPDAVWQSLLGAGAEG